jgi:ornithine cyclodeaminase
MMIMETKNFKKLIIGARSIEKAKVLKERLRSSTGIVIEITTDNNALVRESDVIVTATSSPVPVFDVKPQELKNKTIVAVGSYKPEMQELPLSVFEAVENVFVDTVHAKRECGDISIPLEKGLLKEDDVIPFSEILKKPELKNKGVNVFKSVGMALFDITCADVIYRNAKKRGLGTEIEL